MIRYKMGKAVSVAILIAGISVAPLSAIHAQGTVAPDDASTKQNTRNHSERRHSQRMHRGGSDSAMSDPARRVERMMRYLDLDEPQSQLVSNIMTSAEPELRQLHDSMQQNRNALRSLDPNEPDYATDLQNLATSAGAQATQIALLLGRIRADVNSVLTPEQRAQLQEHAAQRLERGYRDKSHSGAEGPQD